MYSISWSSFDQFIDFCFSFLMNAANEKLILDVMTWLLIVTGSLVFLVFIGTSTTRAAYGRYWGDSKVFRAVSVPAKLAWFLQELPSLLIPLFVAYFSSERSSVERIIPVLLFCGHYFQRSCIYPFLIRGGKPTPFHTFVLAMIFCSYNGFLQARYSIRFSTSVSLVWRLVGLVMFFTGMAINIHSDHTLRTLRHCGETGYKIPIGGLFSYISCPNYFGEFIEWVGYACYTQTFPAWAFAFFTVANLGPRAVSHHKFYLKKFDQYPKNRKAFIPFVL